jgi:hypothetical protein
MAKLNGETLWLRLTEVTTSVLVHDCSKIVRVTVPAFLSGTAVGPAPGAAAARGVASPPVDPSEVALVISKTSSWLVPATTYVGLRAMGPLRPTLPPGVRRTGQWEMAD